MILPIIDYVDIFCHNKDIKLTKKFQVIRNRCIRIICELHTRANTQSEESRLNLMPLHTRRTLHIIQFASEMVFKQPGLFKMRNTFNNSSGTQITTRSQDPERTQLDLFSPSKSLTEKSISYTLRKAWNSLPTWAHSTPDKKTLLAFC